MTTKPSERTDGERCARVPAQMDGWRLDQMLADLFPGRGLRFRQRLWQSGNVLVDGVPRAKGYTVQAGQIVVYSPHERSVAPEEPSGVYVVAATERFAAVFKPRGVHSARVDLKPGPTVEAELEGLFPGRHPVLLNRLDFPTSGLLLVAFGEKALKSYRDMQEQGKVRKVYLAVVQGVLQGEVTVKRRIDSARRKKVRVTEEDCADPLRWTMVRGLGWCPEAKGSLVEVVIFKGYRHHIRAHLAHLGHPIRGDSLYGGGKADHLYLHHHQIFMDGLSACADPDWIGQCQGLIKPTPAGPWRNPRR